MPVVPSLDSAGWIGDIIDKADKILAYYFVSEHSQSNFYPDEVSSLPYVIQNYAHERRTLETEAQRSLRDLLVRYFENARVECTVVTDDDSAEMDMRFAIEVEDQSQRLSLSRLAVVRDSAVQRIVDLNNEGDRS